MFHSLPCSSFFSRVPQGACCDEDRDTRRCESPGGGIKPTATPMGATFARADFQHRQQAKRKLSSVYGQRRGHPPVRAP